VICPSCQAAEVAVEAACPSCGAIAVAPAALDSLLAVEVEEVQVPIDDEPGAFTPLAVRPAVPVDGSGDSDGVGTVDPEAARPVTSVRADEPAGEPWRAGPSDRPDAALAPPTAASADEAPTRPAAELPHRRALADTPAQWGPRQHPTPVMAPPPPAPLDPPPVARTRAPSGTGLPPGFTVRPSTSGPPASAPPAPAPSSPAQPAATAEPRAAVPDRPSHPRVRRWFGRGAGPDPQGEPVADPASDPSSPSPVPSAFDGAPDGLLDGVEPEPDLGAVVIDPGGIDEAAARLSAGARRNANAALAVVAALLEDGERAEAVVQGDYQHRPGVAVLTDRRLIVANDRRWAPDVRSLECDEHLVVHGWQDDRRATLVFVVDQVGIVLSSISDRPLARDLAARVRSRTGGTAGSGAPSL
jgi:hypothetical protein